MSRKHSSRSVAVQQIELAMAAPQVVAHRVLRMMTAGATPQPRDTAEFARMVSEKTSAFSQSWVASWTAMWWAPWRVVAELLRSRSAWGGVANGLAPVQRAWNRQGWNIAGTSLAPVHRTAVANARRLRRE
jgi:hypothetical protein